MSDSADAIGGSNPDWDARLNFHTPAGHSVRASKANSKLSKSVDEGGAEKQRLEFPAAKLGRMRSPLSEKPAESETKQPAKQESPALQRKRRREEERERARAEKAERLAKQLAIEECQEIEVDWRKQMKRLALAWIVGLLFNALVLVYLWCYVSSWGRDQEPLTLAFSSIEVQAEEQPEVNFTLPTEAASEEDAAEIEQTLVEDLTTDVEIDWSEEPDGVLDSLAEGLFDSVDPGASAVPGGADDGSKGTSFFGIESSGDRLVFVVDCSGSMGYERRFQRAIYELSQSLRLMERNQQFLVVLYNDGVFPMLDTPLFETRPIVATEKNIERVMRWVKAQRPVGSTYPSRALQGSLEVKPSSIFFLSDGELNDDTIGMLRRMNVSNSATGARKVPIHTVTLGSTGIGAGMMKVIAEENDGQFAWAQ